VAHIVPKENDSRERAIIVLNGKETDQMFWKEDISMFAQWSGQAIVIRELLSASWPNGANSITMLRDLAQQTSYEEAA
jgi:hypothetical protein